MTGTFLGTIVRLNTQRDSVKTPDGRNERYTPEKNLVSVPEVRLNSDGLVGVTADGEEILDVHNRRHPSSHFRGDNGISMGFTSHYKHMRERFGDHISDGIAGESMIVERDGRIFIDDLAQGIVVRGDDGREVEVRSWSIALPCSPYTRFCLKYGPDDKSDRNVTEGLQFLSDGSRGFNGRYEDDQPQDVVIRVGDRVYLREDVAAD